jgi:hypothetical protein
MSCLGGVFSKYTSPETIKFSLNTGIFFPKIPLPSMTYLLNYTEYHSKQLLNTSFFFFFSFHQFSAFNFTLFYLILCYRLTFYFHIGTLPVFKFEKDTLHYIERCNGTKGKRKIMQMSLQWQNLTKFIRNKNIPKKYIGY